MGQKNLFTVLTEESSIPDDDDDDEIIGINACYWKREINKHRKWSAWEIKRRTSTYSVLGVCSQHHCIEKKNFFFRRH